MEMERVTKDRVTVMIAEAIDKYDVKQDRRHRENSSRLESILGEQRKVAEALAANRGAHGASNRSQQWLMVVAAAMGSGMVALGIEIIKHAVGWH